MIAEILDTPSVVIVEERDKYALDRLKVAFGDDGNYTNEFLPLEERLLPRMSGSHSDQFSSIGFSARVDDREVAYVTMFIHNCKVFVGGAADFLASQDITIRRALLHAVESKSKYLGASSVSLYTPGFSIPAIALYKTLGYYFSGQRKIMNGATLLHMEKKFN